MDVSFYFFLFPKNETTFLKQIKEKYAADVNNISFLLSKKKKKAKIPRLAEIVEEARSLRSLGNIIGHLKGA